MMKYDMLYNKIGFGSSGLESMDLENASAEDIIASVEKMIKNEETKNTQMKKDKKATQKTLDLDVGIAPTLAAKPQAAKTNASNAGKQITTTAGESTADGTEEDNNDDLFSALDEDITVIRRKTIAIKSDNV